VVATQLTNVDGILVEIFLPQFVELGGFLPICLAQFVQARGVLIQVLLTEFVKIGSLHWNFYDRIRFSVFPPPLIDLDGTFVPISLSEFVKIGSRISRRATAIVATVKAVKAMAQRFIKRFII